jgi:hypothetical protein
VRSILYMIILQSTQLANALHCMLPSKLSSHSQAHSQLHLMTLPTCLTICFQVSSPNALKYTSEFALIYTPHCTWYHTPILLDYTLPRKLWRCSQLHSHARSPLHSPEARHFQSYLTICSHVCPWVLDPETSWVAGTRYQKVNGRWREVWKSRWVADSGGPNHDVGLNHSLNLIFSLATTTRSHNGS